MKGTRNLLARYALKWSPFSPQIPTEACLVTPAIDHFGWRLENLAYEGGFALVTGDPGSGKSVAMRIVVARLKSQRDTTVGILTRPQSSLNDFYRELGDLFGVQLSPHNRWAGATVLRERWHRHIETELVRAVLVVDEAQEIHPTVLNELRFLSSADLDSRSLLTVVLAGDDRLPKKFQGPELLSLGTRIRVRLTLGHASPEDLVGYLRHVTREAGNAQLMTAQLMTALAEHAAGNLRILMSMAGELLDAAVQRDVDQLDEKLYFEVFSPPTSPRKGRKPAGGAR